MDKIKWIIEGFGDYGFGPGRTLYNIVKKKVIKKRINGDCIGYWLGKKFLTTKKLEPLMRVSKDYVWPEEKEEIESTPKINIAWYIKGVDGYVFDDEKRLINTRTGNTIKKSFANSLEGYRLNKKFYSLKKLRPLLTKIKELSQENQEISLLKPFSQREEKPLTDIWCILHPEQNNKDI